MKMRLMFAACVPLAVLAGCSAAEPVAAPPPPPAPIVESVPAAAPTMTDEQCRSAIVPPAGEKPNYSPANLASMIALGCGDWFNSAQGRAEMSNATTAWVSAEAERDLAAIKSEATRIAKPDVSTDDACGPGLCGDDGEGMPDASSDGAVSEIEDLDRPLSSGEEQLKYGCEQGYITEGC